MGNNDTKDKSAGKGSSRKTSLTKYSLEKAKSTLSIANKHNVYKAIYFSDQDALKKIFFLFNLDPTEELSGDKSFWNSLHYACFLDAIIPLEFLLKIAYMKGKDQYIEAVNSTTKEGYTPLMIAVMNGKTRAADVLIKAGGLNIQHKDKKGNTAYQLAEKHKKDLLVDLLCNEEFLIIESNYTAINEQFLADSDLSAKKKAFLRELNPVGVEDMPEYRELLLKGRRSPCSICQDDKGWLKYTKCCGQPLHSLCLSPKLTACPYCKAKDLELVDEVYYPERAFDLSKKSGTE